MSEKPLNQNYTAKVVIENIGNATETYQREESKKWLNEIENQAYQRLTHELQVIYNRIDEQNQIDRIEHQDESFSVRSGDFAIDPEYIQKITQITEFIERSKQVERFRSEIQIILRQHFQDYVYRVGKLLHINFLAYLHKVIQDRDWTLLESGLQYYLNELELANLKDKIDHESGFMNSPFSLKDELYLFGIQDPAQSTIIDMAYKYTINFGVIQILIFINNSFFLLQSELYSKPYNSVIQVHNDKLLDLTPIAFQCVCLLFLVSLLANDQEIKPFLLGFKFHLNRFPFVFIPPKLQRSDNPNHVQRQGFGDRTTQGLLMQINYTHIQQTLYSKDSRSNLQETLQQISQSLSNLEKRGREMPDKFLLELTQQYYLSIRDRVKARKNLM